MDGGALVLSTLDAALGLRALVRLRMRRKNVWVWMVGDRGLGAAVDRRRRRVVEGVGWGRAGTDETRGTNRAPS